MGASRQRMKRPRDQYRDQFGFTAARVVVVFLGVCAGAVFAQNGAPLSASPGSHPRAIKEIDDPATATRWLLFRAGRAGGPGRLVTAQTRPSGEQAGPDVSGEAPLRVVIRGGDRLVIEGRTPVSEERLEATALGPAAIGSVFEARLAVGGACVHAIALGPGRAEIHAENEAWR
jgi:hypothetical protein